MNKLLFLPLLLSACGGGSGPETPDAGPMIGVCPEDLTGQYDLRINEKLSGVCDTVGATQVIVNIFEDDLPGEVHLIIVDEEGEFYSDKKAPGCSLDFAFIHDRTAAEPNKVWMYSVTIIDTSTVAICSARYVVTGTRL